MLGNLRYSDLLNHGWEFDKPKRARVKGAERDYRIMAAASPKLDWVTHLTVQPKWPQVAHALARPFVYADKLSDARPEGAGEAWALETWSPMAQQTVARLCREVGMPDVARDPCRLVVFPGDSGGARNRRLGHEAKIDAAVTGLGRVEGVRIARTLDRAHVAAIWRLSGDSLGAALERVSLSIILMNQRGEEVARQTAWTHAAADSTALVWCTLPRDRWRAATRVRMLAWDGVAKRACAWRLADGAELPSGIRVAGDAMEMDLDLWAPWAKARKSLPNVTPNAGSAKTETIDDLEPEESQP